jgi:hypothetical protein
MLKKDCVSWNSKYESDQFVASWEAFLSLNLVITHNIAQLTN